MNNNNLALLKCTSSYPAPIEDANLKTMTSFKKDFDVEIGLSDHTLGEIVPICAVSLGAKIVEKHFIIDRKLGGPDAEFSLNREEFSQLVKSIRSTEKAIGFGNYPVTDKMFKSRQFSRSLYFVQDIKKGEIITSKHVRSIRPGHGIHPKYLNEIIGTASNNDFNMGDRVPKNIFNT